MLELNWISFRLFLIFYSVYLSIIEHKIPDELFVQEFFLGFCFVLEE